MKKKHLHTFSFTNIEEVKVDTSINSSSSDLLHQEKRNVGISQFLSHWANRSFQKKNFIRKFPILSWIPEYKVGQLLSDFIAGLTLGLTTIPQVLGITNVAEMPPEYGLYSAFVGSFIYIFLGSTKYITIGPTVTTAIITLSYTKGQPPEFSVLLCFLTGVVTLLLSIFQLGFIVNFISKPVISGFTSAAAISIASTQIKGLLGLSFDANGFLEEVEGVIGNIGDSKWEDAVAALISLTCLYFLMKIETIFKYFGDFGPRFKKFLWLLSTSRSVIVVVVGTCIASTMGDPSPLGIVGEVPSGMPSFKPPPFSYSEKVGNSTVEFSLGSALREKTSALIIIPFLCLCEHITITRAFSGTSRIDVSQELLCLGVSNIIGSFFSSMPVTGAFGRTALNYASGAQSPLGGAVTGSIVILALVVLTPQFYYIPRATLNSVVIMAVVFMIDFDILVSIWRSKKLDLLPWTVTFLVSLGLGLEYGIMSGFAVSVLFLLYYASRPGIKVSKGETGGGNEFLWLEIDRSMTFPSMEYTSYTVMKSQSKWREIGTVVLDCQFVTFADYTAAQGLTDILKLFKDKQTDIILWHVKPSIRNIWDVVLHKNNVTAIFCSNEPELDMELCRIQAAKRRFSIKDPTLTKINLEEGEDNNNYEPEDDEKDIN